jgi:hypothetical protein
VVTCAHTLSIPTAPAGRTGPIHERGIGQMGEIQVLLALYEDEQQAMFSSAYGLMPYWQPEKATAGLHRRWSG